MSEPADKEWLEAYRRGAAGPWRTRDDVSSPPPSGALIAHFAYLDGLIAGIRALDAARSEQWIRRAYLRLTKRGRRDAR
jgi:hypothetical protein